MIYTWFSVASCHQTYSPSPPFLSLVYSTQNTRFPEGNGLQELAAASASVMGEGLLPGIPLHWGPSLQFWDLVHTFWETRARWPQPPRSQLSLASSSTEGGLGICCQGMFLVIQGPALLLPVLCRFISSHKQGVGGSWENISYAPGNFLEDCLSKKGMGQANRSGAWALGVGSRSAQQCGQFPALRSKQLSGRAVTLSRAPPWPSLPKLATGTTLHLLAVILLLILGF